MSVLGARVLLVDDDALLMHRLGRHLREQGLVVSVAYSAEEARHAMRQTPPDLVVLDWNLPDRDGVAALADWRAEGFAMPVMMLSGNVSTAHRVGGLRVGADDYLIKPFDVQELLARMEALLRRSGWTRVGHGPFAAFGPYRLDVMAAQLWRADASPAPMQPVVLATGEMALLLALGRHPNQVLSRLRLLELMGDAFGERHERSVDLRVARLRDRLGDDAQCPDWVVTVRGLGYRLQTQTQPGEGVRQ